MTTEIRVPQLPESIVDGHARAWHKQPGDAIRRDENLADLETDKVVLEVPAPAKRRGARDPGAERRGGDQRPGSRAHRGGRHGGRGAEGAGTAAAAAAAKTPAPRTATAARTPAS